MSSHLHQRSTVEATLDRLRAHALLVVVGVFTAFVLAVGGAESLLQHSALPFVFFLILGVVILGTVLRLDIGRHHNDGKL